MLNLLSIFVIALGISSSQSDSSTRIILTNVEKNIYEETQYVTGKDLTPDCKFPWSVRKYILHGGKQEGVEVIEVNNGTLSFKVIPTRGMSIYEVTMGDLRLGWDSPVKGPVHPKYINLESRQGLGWLDGFNEWMVRCGLEFFGGPGTDQFIDNTGNKAEMDLTLHGKIGNIPASVVEVIIEREEPYRITVCGKVEEALLHGPKLEIWTKISTVPGSAEFQISDTITNNSAIEQEFGILYHGNYTTPFMEENARFVSPARQVIPINEHAAKNVNVYDLYRAPMPGFPEQVYCLTLWADDNDRTKVMLRNAASDLGVSMAYSTKELPFFTLWKNPVAIEDGYVTGLEPGTGFPRNRSIERKFGRVPKLGPNQSRSFTIDFAILTNKEQVETVTEEIARIQNGRKTEIASAPLPTEPVQTAANVVPAKPAMKMADVIKSAKTWEPAFNQWHGKPAPDFSIKDINGRTHKISEYRGKNLIINIWATWCPPCRREIPDFIELRKNTNEDDLAILGISTERGELNLVKQFVAKEKMNYTILIDEGTFVPPYSQISAIPTTFFIDSKGIIKIATIGVLTLEDMKNILQAQ